MSKFSYPLIGFVIILFFFFPSCHKKNPSEPSQSNMWVAINHGLNNLQIRDIAIDPSNSKIIYVGTPEGVFRTDDAGKNWKLKNNGLTYRDITDLEIISNEFAIILSATWGGGVFISENAGESWTAMNNGLADPRVSVIIATTDINPMFYAGTETGLFNSKGKYEKWNKIEIAGGAGPITSICINGNEPSVIYIGAKYLGLFQTNDAGLSWVQKNIGLPNTAESGFATPTDIQINPYNDQHLFLAAGWSGLFVSYDGALSWQKIATFPSGYYLRTIAIDFNKAENIYVGTTEGILYSKNANLDWISFNDGLTTLDVRAIAIDPKDTRIIYAGTMGGGVFKYVRE